MTTDGKFDTFLARLRSRLALSGPASSLRMHARLCALSRTHGRSVAAILPTAGLALAISASTWACGAPASAPAGPNASTAASAPQSAPAAAGVEYDPAELVQVSLLADTQSLAPGQEITLAAQFDIAPDWHIYWHNPGESGLATEVEFELPDGFELGPARYPGPIAFTSPGPVTSYGYAEDVLISHKLRAPLDLSEGPIKLTAKAYWLACREVCVRGSGEAALSLALTPAPDAPNPSAPLRVHEERLPKPMAALTSVAPTAERGQAGPVLSLPIARTEPIRFFPDSDSDLAVAEQETQPSPDGTGQVLTIQLRAQAAPARLGGVIAVGTGQAAEFYAVDWALP